MKLCDLLIFDAFHGRIYKLYKDNETSKETTYFWNGKNQNKPITADENSPIITARRKSRTIIAFYDIISGMMEHFSKKGGGEGGLTD